MALDWIKNGRSWIADEGDARVTVSEDWFPQISIDIAAKRPTERRLQFSAVLPLAADDKEAKREAERYLRAAQRLIAFE